MRVARKLFVRNRLGIVGSALMAVVLSIFLSSCDKRKNAVSGTIEVDEAHVGPRSSGRVEKIFAQEAGGYRSTIEGNASDCARGLDSRSPQRKSRRYSGAAV